MRVVFIGTGEIGVPTLRALLDSPNHEVIAAVTQPDKPVGRDQRIQASPVKEALKDTTIPILQPRKIREESAVAELSAFASDVIVVAAYGQILPRSVLDLPRLACLNLHASLLPRHRGAAPIQAAIAAGDQQTGITVMYMDEGLDTGDILSRVCLTIEPDDTGGSLHDRLSKLAPPALLAALDQMGLGAAPRMPQEDTLATYAPKLERADGRIDWAEDAKTIERKIRAFDPWPGTFTEIAGADGKVRSLKIFRASPMPEIAAAPGTILQLSDAIVTACGRGALRLEEVQLEGKRRLTAAEFFRGFSSLSFRF